MRVSIWDMDFYYKRTFTPNPILMKISSFHKQQGHLVNFVTEKYHINLAYDVYYISKIKKNTPRPPSNLTDDKRTKLLGKWFKYQNNYYEIDSVIAAVRPDYMLYPEKEKDSYYNANLVQFYYKGTLLKKRQPFENTKKHHKKTLIVDKEFWDSTEENIIFCLHELTNYKNIAFSFPIKSEILIKNEKIRKSFLNLHFSQGTIFKFQNNFGSKYEEITQAFEFIKSFKEKNPHIKIGSFPIKTVTESHWESQKNGIDDLIRCLKIFDLAKKEKLNIIFVAPERRNYETPYWYYFEILEIWTRYFKKYSYIEMMLHSAMKRYKIEWYLILNNSLKWNLPNIDFLLKVMTKFPEEIEKYGYRQWGEKMLDKELIDFKEIKKYKGIFKLEEEKWQN